MVDISPLLDAYHAFLLGSYQQALKLLQKIKDNQLQEQIDILTYRIYIAQKKFGIVLDEVSEDCDSLDLKFIHLLALFATSPSKRTVILNEAEKLLSANQEENNNVFILAATLFLNANSPELALKSLHTGSDIYCNALRVQCLMSMHRYDLASKTLRRMQTSDEGALPCELATALFNLSKGGDQLQEALNIYEELKDRYGSTPVILNGQAAALIGLNRWEDADAILQEAIDLDSSHPDTLVNTIMVSQHLGKSNESTVNRLLSQLKDTQKDHPFLTEYADKEEEFARCAERYAPKIST